MSKLIIVSFVSLLFFTSISAQTTVWSNDFESYQGFGDIPAGYGGGMRVYATHGEANSKGLCINFSQFKSVDSTITPATPIIPAGSVFKFSYRYVYYIGSNPGSPYSLNSDALEIYIRIAGTNDFGSPLLVINSANHIESLGFAMQSIDLEAFTGESIEIKIKGIRGNVDDFWLDTDNFLVESTEPNSLFKMRLQEGINVFPNPATQRINFQFENENSMRFIEVYNVNGSLVLKQFVPFLYNQISISMLTKGVYSGRVYDGYSVFTKSFVVE
jgi:hypothetical protein